MCLISKSQWIKNLCCFLFLGLIPVVPSFAASLEVQSAAIRQAEEAADSLARAIIEQETLLSGRGAVQDVDRYLMQKRIEFADNVAEKAKEYRQVEKEYLTDLDREKYRKIESLTRTTKYSKWVFMTIGGSTGLVLGGATIPFLGPVGIFPLFMGPVLGLNIVDHLRDKYGSGSDAALKSEAIKRAEMSFLKKRRKAFNDLLFTRLAEHGIEVPKKNREEWLLAKLNGDAVPHWESLNAAQKLQLAESYREFMANLAATIEVNLPEVAQEIREAAKDVRESSEQVRWWRVKSMRTLGQHVTESIKLVNELDKKYQILSDAESVDVLNLENRMVVDHAEIFSPETRETIRKSRIALPAAFQVYGPALKKMGAQISFAVSPQYGNQYGYEWRIIFPGEIEPISLKFNLNDKQGLVMSESRALALTRIEAVEFGRQFNLQMESIRFSEAIETRQQKLFPEESCRHALSTASVELKAVIAEAAEAF